MINFEKNNLLKHISKYFEKEIQINPERIFEINNNKIRRGNIVYLCQREIRAKDNYVLQFAKQKSEELNLPLKIIHKKIFYKYKPKQEFINRQILQAKNEFLNLNFDFEIFNGDNILGYLNKINTSVLIIDFNPIFDINKLKNCEYKIYEIDGHNIIPARFISNKQEYNAVNFRRKIYLNIYPFLKEFDNENMYKNEADFVLENFIKNKLRYYNQFRNDPNKNVNSGLSKYLNSGFISSQRIAIDIIKSNVSNENKEAFLEELIIRKELADNFCLYNKKFKSFLGIPNWAKESLNSHRCDFRPYIYTIDEFEQAKTHDELWNAAQKQLIKEGIIHSYLRMYWAKKILEWSVNPEIALKIAIYLNDKYALDAPSPNGYTGILWAIGGLHDRAFKDWFITGKIRRMTQSSIKKKFNAKNYINEFI